MGIGSFLFVDYLWMRSWGFSGSGVESRKEGRKEGRKERRIFPAVRERWLTLVNFLSVFFFYRCCVSGTTRLGKMEGLVTRFGIAAIS